MNLAMEVPNRNVSSENFIPKHFSMEEIMTIIAEHGLQCKKIIWKAIEAARKMLVAEQRGTPYMTQLNSELRRAQNGSPQHTCY